MTYRIKLYQFYFMFRISYWFYKRQILKIRYDRTPRQFYIPSAFQTLKRGKEDDLKTRSMRATGALVVGRNMRKVWQFRERENQRKSKVNFSTSARSYLAQYAGAVRLCFRLVSWTVRIELTLKYESNATNISGTRHILSQKRSWDVSLALPCQELGALRCINNLDLMWEKWDHKVSVALSLWFECISYDHILF